MPSHPGKHSGSTGWINNAAKVEHNSLRSALFWDADTEKYTGAPSPWRPWPTHTGTRTRTHTGTLTQHTHQCKAACVPFMNYWDDETGWEDARLGGGGPIYTSLYLHAAAVGWEGPEQQEGDWRGTPGVGGARGSGRMEGHVRRKAWQSRTWRVRDFQWSHQSCGPSSPRRALSLVSHPSFPSFQPCCLRLFWSHRLIISTSVIQDINPSSSYQHIG